MQKFPPKTNTYSASKTNMLRSFKQTWESTCSICVLLSNWHYIPVHQWLIYLKWYKHHLYLDVLWCCGELSKHYRFCNSHYKNDIAVSLQLQHVVLCVPCLISVYAISTMENFALSLGPSFWLNSSWTLLNTNSRRMNSKTERYIPSL